MAKPRPWDQRPDESTKAYEAFSIYRDMGIGRSVIAAWKQYSKSDRRLPGYFGQWATDNEWVNRARLYDQHIDLQARKKVESDAIKRKADMLKRHADTGRALQQFGLKHIKKNADGPEKSVDAIAAIRSGVEIERKAENLPDWIFEVVNADDDELARQYNELLATIGSDGSGNEAAGDADTGSETSAQAAADDADD